MNGTKIFSNRIQFGTKRANSLTSKSILLVLLVIFVFFAYIMIMRGRQSASLSKEKYGKYGAHQDYLVMYLSNPNCVIVGNSLTKARHQGIYSMVDSTKMQSQSSLNEDIWCIEDFDFLPSIRIMDSQNQGEYEIGLDEKKLDLLNFEKIMTSMPVVIRYDTGDMHTGFAILSSYYGLEADFYGALKKTCHLRDGTEFRLDSVMNISYDNGKNLFSIGTMNFKPYFSCRIESFFIPPGDTIAYIKYNDSVQVVI